MVAETLPWTLRRPKKFTSYIVIINVRKRKFHITFAFGNKRAFENKSLKNRNLKNETSIYRSFRVFPTKLP